MNQPKSIDEVIQLLNEVIAWSKQHNSRMGYFACLYKNMTIAVQNGIKNDFFEDGPRMERLDVNFANRYLQAWHAYTHNQPCSNAWCAAFEACEKNSLVVLQHLLLGINTHINLDLGIAAAQTCPGQEIYALEKDFNRINDIISSLSQQVQDILARVWFPLKALRKISNNREEPVLNFSINTARRTSWANGVALALVQGQAHYNYVKMMDDTVVKIATRIMKPGLLLTILLRPVLFMESKNVGKIIGLLQADPVVK